MLSKWVKLKYVFIKFFEQDKGAIAIITGLLIVSCVGFAALAIDAGSWYNQKRQLQLAADAGAIGGAFAFAKTGKATVNAYATHDLALNGCTGANNCTIAAINNPPSSGTQTGNNTAVEVLLTKPAPLYLSGLFLPSSPTMHARAVAGQKPSSTCLISLATAGVGLTTKGTTTLNSPTCGIYVDSAASNAVKVTGGAVITTSAVNVVGGTSTSGGGTIVGPTSSGVPILSDPMSGLQIPTYSSSCDASHTDFSLKSASKTINPGVYCGGINVGTSAQLTMTPGVYTLIESGKSTPGNFNIGSQATVTGSGVTIILTSTSSNYGTVSLGANASATLSPPTTGTTAGILFFGDRNSSGLTHSFTGGSAQLLSGILYFPTADLTYSGSASAVGNPCFQIIANTITLTGSASFGNGCPASIGPIALFE